mmetsp:Transcript_28908/g.71533  ORF Transcript_28908/g.71533 Transcript_28908/m.71533 type:complete len:217 (-) Transcript_28908:543-1193(-)
MPNHLGNLILRERDAPKSRKLLGIYAGRLERVFHANLEHGELDGLSEGEGDRELLEGSIGRKRHLVVEEPCLAAVEEGHVVLLLFSVFRNGILCKWRHKIHEQLFFRGFEAPEDEAPVLKEEDMLHRQICYCCRSPIKRLYHIRHVEILVFLIRRGLLLIRVHRPPALLLRRGMIPLRRAVHPCDPIFRGRPEFKRRLLVLCCILLPPSLARSSPL